MTEREKQLARVKALLAKTTDRGATQEESMLAAAKAAQLMDEHNISLAETTEAGTKHFDRRDISPKERWKAEFYGWIGYEVGRFTGTVSTARRHSLRGQYATASYYGAEGDVIFADWLTRMLGDFVFTGYQAKLKAFKAIYIHNNRKAAGNKILKTFRDSYLVGASQAIVARLKEMTAERTTNAQTRNALTVIDKWQAAMTETKKITEGITKQRRVTEGYRHAFAAGVERGQEAPFNRPIGNDADRPLMIATR